MLKIKNKNLVLSFAVATVALTTFFGTTERVEARCKWNHPSCCVKKTVKKYVPPVVVEAVSNLGNAGGDILGEGVDIFSGVSEDLKDAVEAFPEATQNAFSELSETVKDLAIAFINLALGATECALNPKNCAQNLADKAAEELKNSMSQAGDLGSQLNSLLNADLTLNVEETKSSSETRDLGPLRISNHTYRYMNKLRFKFYASNRTVASVKAFGRVTDVVELAVRIGNHGKANRSSRKKAEYLWTGSSVSSNELKKIFSFKDAVYMDFFGTRLASTTLDEISQISGSLQKMKNDISQNVGTFKEKIESFSSEGVKSTVKNLAVGAYKDATDELNWDAVKGSMQNYYVAQKEKASSEVANASSEIQNAENVFSEIEGSSRQQVSKAWGLINLASGKVDELPDVAATFDISGYLNDLHRPTKEFTFFSNTFIVMMVPVTTKAGVLIDAGATSSLIIDPFKQELDVTVGAKVTTSLFGSIEVGIPELLNVGAGLSGVLISGGIDFGMKASPFKDGVSQYLDTSIEFLSQAAVFAKAELFGIERRKDLVTVDLCTTCSYQSRYDLSIAPLSSKYKNNFNNLVNHLDNTQDLTSAEVKDISSLADGLIAKAQTKLNGLKSNSQYRTYGCRLSGDAYRCSVTRWVRIVQRRSWGRVRIIRIPRVTHYHAYAANLNKYQEEISQWSSQQSL